MLEKDPVTGLPSLAEGDMEVKDREHLIEIMDAGWIVTRIKDGHHRAYKENGEYLYGYRNEIPRELCGFLDFNTGGGRWPQILYLTKRDDHNS